MSERQFWIGYCIAMALTTIFFLAVTILPIYYVLREGGI
jgi:hypothetical protein